MSVPWPVVSLFVLGYGLVTGLAAGDAVEPVGWNGPFFAGMPGDAVSVVAMPASWSGSDWLWAGGAVGLGCAIYAADPAIDRWVQEHRGSGSDAVASTIAPLGREVLAVGLLATAGASFVSDDPRVRRTALLGGEALLFTFVAHTAISTVAGRERPEDGQGSSAWDGPGGGDSFPSGHTAAAFAVAAVVAHEWEAVPWAAPAAYGTATLVGLARIGAGAHWTSDVYAGALLGLAMGYAVESLHPPGGHSAVTVTPWWDGRDTGLVATLRF